MTYFGLIIAAFIIAAALCGVEKQLKRIADALEQQNASRQTTDENQEK